MIRRAFMIAAALVPLVVVPVGVASATGQAIVGTGTKTCGGTWVGTLSFVPHLTKAGPPTSDEVVYLKATARPCHGGNPTVSEGKIFGRSESKQFGANLCATVFKASPPGGAFTWVFPFRFETVTWVPALALTNVSFPTMKVTTPALATGTVNFSSVGGTAVGSFPTVAATQSMNTVKSDAAIRSAGPGDCGSAGGVASLAIRAAGTTGTF